MVCCCAVGCSNSNRKGFRLFLIPREIKRRELWLAKIRRDKWTPTSGSRLCEAHFEESAFEQNRIDGWKKLKQTAIPTIFPTVEVVQRHLNGKVQIKEEAPKVSMQYLKLHHDFHVMQINLLSSKGARTPEPSAPNFLEEKNNVPLLQMRTRATQVYFRSVSTQTNSSARSAGVQVNLELLGSQYAR
uniref:Putative 52 kDa repressor of the inhibitor of the protein kin n=1 Tax=Ixodes ricinus TaxID=34613 RepID=V5H071_IXORI